MWNFFCSSAMMDCADLCPARIWKCSQLNRNFSRHCGRTGRNASLVFLQRIPWCSTKVFEGLAEKEFRSSWILVSSSWADLNSSTVICPEVKILDFRSSSARESESRILCTPTELLLANVFVGSRRW